MGNVKLHKLSSVLFRDRTEKQQKLHGRNLSVVMSSVMIKTHFAGEGKTNL